MPRRGRCEVAVHSFFQRDPSLRSLPASGQTGCKPGVFLIAEISAIRNGSFRLFSARSSSSCSVLYPRELFAIRRRRPLIRQRSRTFLLKSSRIPQRSRFAPPEPHTPRTENLTIALFPRSFRKIYPEAVRAEGCYIFTADGHKILDACGGAAVVSIGHGVASVAEAIGE